MTRPYLRPEDVGPEDARLVLQFLNAAASAEEIAAAVELADELDVGRRIGARILERRRELGAFTELGQVAAIPLIGPERFTELVVTLSGARLPVRPQVSSPTATAELQRQIGALEATVGALQAEFRASLVLSLHAVQQRPYLGQPVNLVARLGGGTDGRPRLDAPVTFATSWGRVRGTVGVSLREGATVTTRTDGAGMARALLLPPTLEDLLEPQRASLESALAALPADAATPAAAAAALRGMAERYRQPGSFDLRAAIDIYFRDFGQRLLDSLNPRDELAAWPNLDATVFAFAADEGAGQAGQGSVQAAALLTVRLVDWRAPWLQALLRLSAEQSRLAGELDAARDRNREAGPLAGVILSRVRDFVADQPGFLGEYVGKRVAEDSLTRFLDEGIAELPVDTRRALLHPVATTVGTVKTAGAGVLGAVGQTRAELRGEIGTRVGELEQTAIAPLSTRLDEVGLALDKKVDDDTFQGFQATLSRQIEELPKRAAIDTLRADLDAVRASSSQVQEELDSLRNGVVTLQGDLRAVRDGVSRFESDIGELRTFAQTITARVDGKLDVGAFDQFRAETTRQLAALPDAATVKALRIELEAVKAVSGRVETDLRLLDERVKRLDRGVADLIAVDETVRVQLESKLDADVFTDFRTTVNRQFTDLGDPQVLRGLADQVAGLKRSTTQFETNLNRLNTNLTQLGGDLGDLKRRAVLRP